MSYLRFERNISTYKFPDINNDIDQLIKLDKILSTRYKIESKFKVSEFIRAGLFDNNLFNKKIDEINEIQRIRRKIKEKIRLLKLSDEQPDYHKLTIGEFINAIYIDMFSMFRELFNMNKFRLQTIHHILNKNYRRIILVLLFLMIIIFYIFVNLLLTWINK
jgi:hypothetical protein